MQTNGLVKTALFLALLIPLAVLALLLGKTIWAGAGWINATFLSSQAFSNPDKAGILGAMMGTIGLVLIVIPVSLTIGIFTAIYLEEYGKDGHFRRLVDINIANLASIPSVIFGLLGLAVFSRLLGLGSSLLAGGLTLSILVLPIVIVSAQEAIKAVPAHLREASLALGATKWTTTVKVVLPSALPGILTGSILAISRAIGETAPLVVLGVPTAILFSPSSPFDKFTAIPLQIYNWTVQSVRVESYLHLASAAILVLLVILFFLSGLASLIRARFRSKKGES